MEKILLEELRRDKKDLEDGIKENKKELERIKKMGKRIYRKQNYPVGILNNNIIKKTN